MKQTPFVQTCLRVAIVFVGGFWVAAVIGHLRNPPGQQSLQTHVAGAPYRIGFATQVDTVFHPGQNLRAIPEHSRTGAAVRIALYQDDEKVGYLPASDTAQLTGVLAQAGMVAVTVVDVDPNHPWDGVKIRVDLNSNVATGRASAPRNRVTL